ncbi:MAG: aminotransferase class III-fold pyridoxal phosphate-dependent enzyme, partial [Pseudomonadota bacterium]
TGFGRTGEWFASQSMGIEPDTMTLAKAITSGYQPLSAVVLSDRIADVLSSHGEYFHGYTYSGHPVACAVALANIDIIEREGLIDRVKTESGPYLAERLEEVVGNHHIVGEVRGFGLLAAIEIVKDKTTNTRFDSELDAAAVVRDHCIEAGMMMRAVGDTMILSPPLTWTKETIDEAADLALIALDKAANDLL